MLTGHDLGLGVALACVISVGAATAAAPPAAKPAAAPSPKAPSDRAQIEALEHRFAAAVGAKNVDKIMSCYSTKGLFVFDVTPPRQHVGWADYKKDWEGFMGSMTGAPKLQVADLDVTVVGPVAYSHSIQTMQTPGPGGATSDFVVRVTDVYRKQAGRWLIVQEHVSVPVDLATAKADLQSKP